MRKPCENAEKRKGNFRTRTRKIELSAEIYNIEEKWRNLCNQSRKVNEKWANKKKFRVTNRWNEGFTSKITVTKRRNHSHTECWNIKLEG